MSLNKVNKIDNCIENREEWIDCLKFIAIIAVVVDHVYGFLYTNEIVVYVTYFSVTLFIWLSGMTAYRTAPRHENEPYIKDVSRKLCKLFGTYSLAAILYVLVGEKFINFTDFVHRLFNFTISAPFYFVLFYSQLIIISRFLYKLISKTFKRKNYFIYIFLELAAVEYISVLLMRYTFILPVNGGGQYLFGGSFLFVYFIGMVSGALYKKVSWKKINSIVLFILCTCLILLWIYFMVKSSFSLDDKLKYFGNINPPGPTLIIYTFFILIWGLSFNAIINLYHINVLLWIRKRIAELGKHTLYIFLYHMLILISLRRSILEVIINNMWVKRVIYLALVVGGGYIYRICI